MRKLIIIFVLLFGFYNTAYSETKNPLKDLETAIDNTFKTLSGKSLNKKETQEFILNNAITLKDERGDGVVTYVFKEKEYFRYKDFKKISRDGWRFTNTGRLRLFDGDVKISWKIKLGREGKKDVINIKAKFDPIGKTYEFSHVPISQYLTEISQFEQKAEEEKKRLEQEKLEAQKKAEEEKERLEQEKLEAQKKAEEEKERLEQEKLEAQKKAEEEKKRLEQEKLEAQKKAEEEKKRLEQEKLEAQKKAEEEKKRLEQEKLEAQKKAEEEKAQLEKEIAEQKRKLEEEKAKLEKEIAEQKRKLEEEKLYNELEPKFRKKCQKKLLNDLYEIGTPEYRTCILNKGPEKQKQEQQLQEQQKSEKKAEEEKKRLEQEKLEAQKKAEEEKKRLEQEKLEAQKKAEEEKKRLEQEKLEAQKKAEISKYPLLIENIKFSLDEDVSNTKKLNYVFTVENRTDDKRLRFYSCIEFLDKKNLNIFKEQGKSMSIGPEDKKIYSDSKRVIENDDWNETAVLNVYLTEYGCSSSSNEFSKPLELKLENGKIFNLKKEIILTDNTGNNSSDSNNSSTSSTSSYFSNKYVYKHYSDGSCTDGNVVFGTGGRIAKCIDLSDYKKLCNLSESITTQARSTSAVLYSGATSTFISQGGTYKGMTVNWQDSKNRCAASFTITGILNGTSTSKTIYGRASTFVKLNNKILINYIDSLD